MVRDLVCNSRRQRQLFDGTTTDNTMSRNCVVCLESIMMLCEDACNVRVGRTIRNSFVLSHKFLQEMSGNKKFNQIYNFYVVSERAKNISLTFLENNSRIFIFL